MYVNLVGVAYRETDQEEYGKDLDITSWDKVQGRSLPKYLNWKSMAQHFYQKWDCIDQSRGFIHREFYQR